MQVWTGSSGFSYAEWKGSFYPEKFSQKKMLAYYGERLSTVEINNTFYRMPKPALLEGWATQVPETFRFALKAAKRITHHQKLADTKDNVAYLFDTAATLGERLGPILFQLPPYLKKDLELLATFLGDLPTGPRVVMEFRSSSWYDDGVFALLRKHNVAMCIADFDDAEKNTPFEATAAHGYLRLRDAAYTDAELNSWAERILAQGWKEAFVYFKHEDEGAAPKLAQRLRDAVEKLGGVSGG